MLPKVVKNKHATHKYNLTAWYANTTHTRTKVLITMHAAMAGVALADWAVQAGQRSQQGPGCHMLVTI